MFFKIKAKITDREDMSCDDWSTALMSASRELHWSMLDDSARTKVLYFVVIICARTAIGVAVTHGGAKKQDVRFPWSFMPFTVGEETVEEITFYEYHTLLSNAMQNYELAYGTDDVCVGSYDDADFYFPIETRWVEEYIATVKPEGEQLDAARRLLWEDSLGEELKRIYASQPSGAAGCPVSYIVCSDKRGTDALVTDSIVAALYDKGRINSLRYTCVMMSETDRSFYKNLRVLYESSVGGTVVIFADRPSYDEAAVAGYVTELAMEYRDRVLTVLWFPKDNAEQKETFKELINRLYFVELRPDSVASYKAREFLAYLAGCDGITADDALLDQPYGGGYDCDILSDIYSKWKYDRLRTFVYPQYKNVNKAQ